MSEPAAGPPQKRKRGKMEKATRKAIKDMDLDGTAAQKLLIEQALAGAKILDEAMEPGQKRYTATVGQRLHRDALDGLRESVKQPEPLPTPEPGERGDFELWIAAVHRPTVECQPSYPEVMPGLCGNCDTAAVARVLYGRRHPGADRHTYGFSRAACGCSGCAD